MEQLKEALKRYKLYKDGKEWDTPAPRPEKISDKGEIDTLPAPSDKVRACPSPPKTAVLSSPT